MSEERIKALKSELKEWEREFAEVNDGKKPSREDIKRNPDIGTKAFFDPYYSLFLMSRSRQI